MYVYIYISYIYIIDPMIFPHDILSLGWSPNSSAGTNFQAIALDSYWRPLVQLIGTKEIKLLLISCYLQ